MKNNIICKNILCDRANEVDSKGNIYTEEALKMLDGQNNIPVIMGFDNSKIVGKANVKYQQGTGLVCTIEATNKEIFRGLKAAPCYSASNIEKTKAGYKIKECSLKSIGIVENHSLNDIPEIN